MRLFLAGVAAVALAVAGGCLDDNGAVRLFVSDAIDVSPLVSGYSSSNADFTPTPDGVLHFTATSNQGILLIAVPGPLVEGTVYELSPGQKSVQFTLGSSVWFGEGGLLVIDRLDPLMVGLSDVTMVAAVDASGSFDFTGTGIFR
jgi:hypothetical protein